MDPTPLPRRTRITRVRKKVVAVATGLFLAVLGVVVGFGNQPAAKTPTVKASTTTYDDNFSDDGSYDDDGGATYQSSPAPMTTRSS